MKRWRWDLFIAAALIAIGLALHGLLPRYVPAHEGFALDTWTGEMCLFGRCFSAPLEKGDDENSVSFDALRESLPGADISAPAHRDGLPTEEQVREFLRRRADPLAGYTSGWRDSVP